MACYEELEQEKCSVLGEIPEHVAIIMDGNRRWAQKKGLVVQAGHWKGAENLTQIVEAASDLGIKTLTVYAFSTENWGRSEVEVESLLELFQVYLQRMRAKMVKLGVKIRSIGDLTPFPKEVIRELEITKEATKDCDRIQLVLALNYGGRDDLRRAITRIVDDVESGVLTREEISEDLLSSYLDTALIGDPQLLIRTSGEKRISNFLLWQISYAEVYLTDTLWPDFTKEDLAEAVLEYQKRARRLGC